MTTAVRPPVDLLRFRVNGRPVEAVGDGARRLLDVLRVDLGLTGTKEGCGEGECGACSVLVDGELVDSCLVPVAQVDGREVLTVEGLAPNGALDPLQEAFLVAGATQCGFCTPGMLLAAHALLAPGRPVTEPEIREAIAGNLCRCTGYTKIIEAIATAAGSGPRPPRERAACAGDAPPVPVTLAPEAAPRVVRPRSLEDALGRLAADRRLRPVAGATDVMVERAMGGPAPAALLDLWDLDDLRGVAVEDGELVVGALTTFAALRASPVVRTALPVLAEVARGVGAVQVRNRGTIGGNCVTASPAGDMLPLLLATDARLEVASAAGSRTIPADGFWTGYRQTALLPGELLVAVRIPLVPGRHVRYRKVGTRRAQSIAKVAVAVAWQGGDLPGAAGGPRGPWREVRVALGSVAPVPIRARRTEALLEGTVAGSAVAARAAAVVREEISPIDDVRSTAEYRREVAGRVLRRLVLDAALPTER